jgi:hypothetical protein
VGERRDKAHPTITTLPTKLLLTISATVAADVSVSLAAVVKSGVACRLPTSW